LVLGKWVGDMRANIVFAMCGALCLGLGFSAANAAVSVTITPQGTIIGSCSLSGFAAPILADGVGNDIDIGTIGASKPADVTKTFGVTCNAPFTMSMQSASGGLVRTGSGVPVIGGGFADRLGYSVTASIPTDDAGVTISKACAASGSTTGSPCTASSGTSTALTTGPGSARLTFAFDTPASGSPFLAGAYRDTLTISVVAQ
jgi:spore coat protein U-like protein